MSISCVKVEDAEMLKKATLFGAKEFVHANIDAATQNQFPFPSDYKFTPCFLPKKYEKFADRILNFKIRSDDTWVATFSKAGTTWAMNVASLLKNNLNFSENYLNAGYNYLEGCVLWDVFYENNNGDAYTSFVKSMDDRFDLIDDEVSPRLIKSHLPSHLLPKAIWTVKPKLIYMYRNAKDVAISMFHMFRNSKLFRFQGSLDDYLDLFLNDHVVYAPFSAHVNGFRKLNQVDHILLVSYDEMMANPFVEVKRISEFLGCKYSDDQLQQLTQHVSFENMRKNYSNAWYLNNFK